VLSKPTHPACPDVNWLYTEKLCLSLLSVRMLPLVQGDAAADYAFSYGENSVLAGSKFGKLVYWSIRLSAGK